jgi:hypothetical protein
MSAMLNTKSLKGGGSSLKMVRRRYSDLNNLIGELSSKLSDVSSSIDSEFLLAYKYHMLDVQRDLQSLKQQVCEIIKHSVCIQHTNRITFTLLQLQHTWEA